MSDENRLRPQEKPKPPGYKSYIECISRAYLTGLATFALGFSSLHFSQKIFAKHLPYNIKTTGVLVSSVIAVCGTYKVTADRAFDCQQDWVVSKQKEEAK